MQHYPFKWESGLSEEYKLGESVPWRPMLQMHTTPNGTETNFPRLKESKYLNVFHSGLPILEPW